jgi:glycosyltransferase involved in cell wall biosynthesis
VLIGDGPLREQLEKSILQRGLQHAVRMTGQLCREALSEELKQVDFCVQPSLSEGLSKAWIDAMAHGLPVLASDVGAARAIIGSHCGWIVPPGNQHDLVATLETILTAPLDWSELRANCVRHVQSLTIERWAARIGAITAEKLDLSFSGARLERRFA